MDQLKALIAALTLLVATLQGYVLHPPVARFSPKEHHITRPGLLGVATVTSGFNYPTTTINFQDGDIVNAGDFNQAFTFIGIKNATDTTSISYNAFNPNLANATGSISSLASTTGQLPIGKGGTATSTFVQGIVIANATSALSTIVPTTNGQIPIASGTQFAANTLTGGAGITVTNGAGSTTIAATNAYLFSTSTATRLANSFPTGASTTVFAATTTPSTPTRYLVSGNIILTTGGSAGNSCILGIQFINSGVTTSTRVSSMQTVAATSYTGSAPFNYVTPVLGATTTSFVVQIEGSGNTCTSNGIVGVTDNLIITAIGNL